MAPAPRAPRCATGGGSRWRSGPTWRRPPPSWSRTPRAGRVGSPGCWPPRHADRGRAHTSSSTRGSTRGVGAHDPADRADTDGLASAAQPFSIAIELERHHRELVAERRGLGVDTVGTAHDRRVPVGQRPAAARPRAAAPAAPSSRSAAARSCSAKPVSSTSEDVMPKWIHRPCSPIDAATTSTNAAMSWRVTSSRSRTASTVNDRSLPARRGVVRWDRGRARPTLPRRAARSRASSRAAVWSDQMSAISGRL